MQVVGFRWSSDRRTRGRHRVKVGTRIVFDLTLADSVSTRGFISELTSRPITTVHVVTSSGIGGLHHLWSEDLNRRGRDNSVLQLTHMETIGIRELQQHASAALRRVARGETLGVTDRGRLVAVLSAPSGTSGVAALTISGRVQPARRRPVELPPAVKSKQLTSHVLDELREDR